MRKRMFSKRGLSILLCLLIVFQMCGCSSEKSGKSSGEDMVQIEPMEIEEPDTYSFDYIGGSDVMPIAGYCGLMLAQYSWNGNNTVDTISEEFFQTVADSGVNMLSYSALRYDKYPNEYKEILELADKYGIGIMVNDGRILQTATEGMTVETVDQYISEYASYSAYCGNYIIDEPADPNYITATLNGTSIDELVTIFDKMDQLGYPAYGNALGGWTPSNLDKYEAYLKKWVTSCKVKFLSASNYGFFGAVEQGATALYFQGLSLQRQVAEEAGIPFWGFTQAGEDFNDNFIRIDSDEQFVTKGTFLWNINVFLSFGAKGIQVFPFTQTHLFARANEGFMDYQRNGILGAAGNKTKWYYYLQEAGKQIAAVDDVLMNAVNKGILITDDSVRESDFADCQYVLEGTSWRELKDVTGNAMIGCFNYQGKTALYVTNYDFEYAQKINLKFVDTYNIKVVQDAETETFTADNLELTLSAGNGALIVFE